MAEQDSPYEVMIAALQRNWWAIAIRGALAILFGLIALFMPGITMLTLVIIFAAYAVMDGIFAIVAAMRAAQRHERWLLLVVEGIADIAAAIVFLVWPEVTVVVFVLVLAVWAIITGLLELAAGIRLDFIAGRGWLIFGGILSVLFGVLLIVAPMAGAVVLTWWLGAYALLFGIALVVLALKLRGRPSV